MSVVSIRDWTADELAALKEDLLRRVDAAFDAKVGKVQSGVLRARAAKREEAEQVLADSDGDWDDFKLLAASRLDGETILQTAQRIYDIAKADDAALATLERQRLAARAAVRVAVNAASAKAAWAVFRDA